MTGWFLDLVIVVPVTAALRLLPGMCWMSRGMDAGAHLLLRRQIRRHGMRLRIEDWPLVLDKRFTYPWAFHWLLALLPESWLRRVPPLPSTICDVMHAVIVMWLAGHLAPLVAPGIDPAVVGLVAGLLFGTAPALLVVGFGPRAYEVTPRPFGELLYTITMTGALLYLTGQSRAGLAAAVLGGGVLLLSSKFAAQVLLFCAPVMALLPRDAKILLLVPVALAAALILSGGGYWWILRSQFIHLRFYRARLQYEHPVLMARNRGRALLAAVIRLLRSRDRLSLADAARLAEGHTLLQFLIRNVLWCGVVALVVAGGFAAWPPNDGRWHAWLMAWAIAPAVPFLITSLRNFRFLGEAERYPEYALAPVAVLAAIGLAGLGRQPAALALAAYAVLCVPALAYTVGRLRWNSGRGATQDLDELVQFLGKQPAAAVVLSLPWHVAFQVMPDLELRYIAALDATAWCLEPEQVFARYPWPRGDFAAWRRNAGLELVIADRRALAAADAMAYDFSGLTPVFRGARYDVYTVA